MKHIFIVVAFLESAHQQTAILPIGEAKFAGAA
jgi:hypothetical protein